MLSRSARNVAKSSTPLHPLTSSLFTGSTARPIFSSTGSSLSPNISPPASAFIPTPHQHPHRFSTQHFSTRLQYPASAFARPTLRHTSTRPFTSTNPPQPPPVDPYQPNAVRPVDSKLPDHRPTETPQERQERLRYTPLARGKGTKVIEDLDSIPDASEAMVEEIIATKPLPIKDVIKMAEQRVEDNSKARLRIANQIPWLLLAVAGLAWLLPRHVHKSKEDQEFSLEHQINLFPKLQDILDPSFHDYLHSSLPHLLVTYFGDGPERLAAIAEHEMAKAKKEYASEDIALTDEEMVAKFEPGSNIAVGSVAFRFFPDSPVYAQYDPQKDPNEDPERYITIKLHNAHNFFRLYMYMLVMHLEQKMTDPVFEYLKDHPELNCTLSMAKNTVWETMNRSILSYDKKVLNMLHAEAGYESVKFHRDKVQADAAHHISLRGLRRVLATLHFAIWSDLKAGTIVRILEKHKAHIEATQTNEHKIDLAVQQEEYLKQFKIMYPQLADPDCVLKYSTEQFQRHFYTAQALIDEVNASEGEELTLAALYRNAVTEILDQAEFKSPELLEKRNKARQDFEDRQEKLASHGIFSPERFFDPTDPARALPLPPSLDRLYEITAMGYVANQDQNSI